MPTYQYRCTECEHEFEKFQPISDDPVSVCPECSGYTERIITGGAGFLLKGSGFYSTDYRSNSYKKGEQKYKTDVTAPAKTESKSDSPAKSTEKKV
ncbi:MAG: FmdB family transcriptional regulator [candidate division Zixibacteria bacterium HGW-Zixibacteria-1]|nr:MAG: FmdB family transcriptional regulator [candidate division Zixibacteria bacterium HGW-Zixibacteria-1]